MLYVGIDTGTHTGLAVWNSFEHKFKMVETMKIHQALSFVKTLWEDLQDNDAGDMMVVFEDARQRKWYGSNSQMKMQGAGSIKRDAVIWEDFLKDNGIPYRAVPPKKGLTKWSAEQFAKVTGWKGRTSEHSRDASLLVYGY